MKRKVIIYLFLLVIFSLQMQAQDDKLSELRTSKKIVSVNNVSLGDDWAIQIMALTEAPQDASFFKNIDEAREFLCVDDYVRYCVESYATYDEAKANIDTYKDLGYVQSFVVNTATFSLKNASRGFVPDPNKSYTIQVSAFRFPLYLDYFEGLSDVMEFYLKDRIYRYTIGKYPYEDAEAQLQSIKDLGYEDAFVTELDAYLPFKIE